MIIYYTQMIRKYTIYTDHTRIQYILYNTSKLVFLFGLVVFPCLFM